MQRLNMAAPTAQSAESTERAFALGGDRPLRLGHSPAARADSGGVRGGGAYYVVHPCDMSHADMCRFGEHGMHRHEDDTNHHSAVCVSPTFACEFLATSARHLQHNHSPALPPSLPTSDIAANKPVYEVCRLFLASLQLTNNGNVTLAHTDGELCGPDMFQVRPNTMYHVIQCCTMHHVIPCTMYARLG